MAVQLSTQIVISGVLELFCFSIVNGICEYTNEFYVFSLTGPAWYNHGFSIFSWDCNYKFQLQSDGQLVLYNSLNTAIWSLQTAAPPNPNLEITQYGTINIWNENKDTIIFSSWNDNIGDSLPGMGDYELTVSNEGSVQLTNADDITLWAIYAEEQWIKLSFDDEYLYLFINQCM
eukprot:510630_1